MAPGRRKNLASVNGDGRELRSNSRGKTLTLHLVRDEVTGLLDGIHFGCLGLLA